jgi:hypothetical protein
MLHGFPFMPHDRMYEGNQVISVGVHMHDIYGRLYALHVAQLTRRLEHGFITRSTVLHLDGMDPVESVGSS